MTITQTLHLLAEDIAARQAQIIIDPPAADDDDDDDTERDTTGWMSNLGLADDVLDLAIALNDIARLISRPRLATWLDNIDISQPASRRLNDLRTALYGPVVVEQPQPVIVAPPEIVELGFDPSKRHNDHQLVDAVVREYIAAHPGLTVEQIAHGINMRAWTARRSCQRLVDVNIIHYSLGHGKGAPRLYRPGPAPALVGDNRSGGQPTNPVGTRAKIIAYLANQTSPLSGREIADAVDANRHHVHTELYKLRQDGRLIATGQPYRYALARQMASAAD